MNSTVLETLVEPVPPVGTRGQCKNAMCTKHTGNLFNQPAGHLTWLAPLPAMRMIQNQITHFKINNLHVLLRTRDTLYNGYCKIKW